MTTDASAPAPSTAAVSTTCTLVAAALSDGPDPAADPVGYAEAQVGPLRQIRTSDPALHAAISSLAKAYAQVFTSSGKSAAAAKHITAASRNVNIICPGAAS